MANRKDKATIDQIDDISIELLAALILSDELYDIIDIGNLKSNEQPKPD